ncbi:MAG: tRNA pseudouridine(13) synthase TruD [Anaerolineales bacterium]
MQIKAQPEDFRVAELIEFPGEQGDHAYYRVEKRGLPTLVIRELMARQLHVRPSAIVVPALKDATAVAVQHFSVQQRGPKMLEGQGFRAERVGWGPRELLASDVQANHFTVVVRDIASAEEAERLGEATLALGRDGLPNYYDDQRFGSYSEAGFLGKAVLLRDAEEVVRLYLAEPMIGDRPEVRKFKALAAEHWGEWAYLLDEAPRPSNFRSVLTYLKDHPERFRQAANLIHNRLMTIYLSAYQSWVWNLILAQYLELETSPQKTLAIIRRSFPLPSPPDDPEALMAFEIPLPRLTARYQGRVGEAAKAVLAAEGLKVNDFKARILERAYLHKGERAIWFRPEEATAASPFEDDRQAGRWAISVAFTLTSGAYATLVMKAAAAHCGETLLVSG